MKVEQLEGARLDYWVARALGHRFWLEQRGDYRLAVIQTNSCEPYMSTKAWRVAKERYEEVFKFSDIKCGFHGSGIPRYSEYWENTGQLIDEFDVSLTSIQNKKLFSAIAGKDALSRWQATGKSRLIAICRAIVGSKFGPEVPDEV